MTAALALAGITVAAIALNVWALAYTSRTLNHLAELQNTEDNES